VAPLEVVVAQPVPAVVPRGHPVPQLLRRVLVRLVRLVRPEALVHQVRLVHQAHPDQPVLPERRDHLVALAPAALVVLGLLAPSETLE